jgi:hypothetical protein
LKARNINYIYTNAINPFNYLVCFSEGTNLSTAITITRSAPPINSPPSKSLNQWVFLNADTMQTPKVNAPAKIPIAVDAKHRGVNTDKVCTPIRPKSELHLMHVRKDKKVRLHKPNQHLGEV